MGYFSRTLAAGLVATALPWGAAWAQSNTEAVSMDGAIKGRMDIVFDTRTTRDTTGDVPDGSPALGAMDTYNVDLDVMNSVVMKGAVTRLPWLPSDVLGVTQQQGAMTYDLRLSLRNPANPSQTRTLGGWIGAMKTDGAGLYHFNEPPEGKGKMRIAIDAIGNSQGFVSEFQGTMQGRIPAQAGLAGLADRASRRVDRTYQRVVNDRVISHTVQGADPMAFQNAILAGGPIQAYPQTQLTGSIDYDPEEAIWYVDLKATYSTGGQTFNDRYSGSIRWNEDANRAANGKGYYEVNVRLNEEQAPTEASIFDPTSAGMSEEEAFFSTASASPGFGGQIAYVDTFNGETVVKSSVTYAINATSASKVQTLNFAKVLLLIIGPFNDE
ncbi:hypothetical protein [Zavarzinia sp. CC-PAN008]|uniref:hypothetical protein n=1 Tax=Zavarzinia sp. CC-PAN008 TaxID=3243332 RepID=UPI003F745D3F